MACFLAVVLRMTTPHFVFPTGAIARRIFFLVPVTISAIN
jgi:hypothetical protein